MPQMTEEQVERRVEKMTDHLDACFMRGGMSQGDYDGAMKDLNRWASAQYDRAAIWDRARERHGTAA